MQREAQDQRDQQAPSHAHGRVHDDLRIVPTGELIRERLQHRDVHSSAQLLRVILTARSHTRTPHERARQISISSRGPAGASRTQYVVPLSSRSLSLFSLFTEPPLEARSTNVCCDTRHSTPGMPHNSTGTSLTHRPAATPKELSPFAFLYRPVFFPLHPVCPFTRPTRPV